MGRASFGPKTRDNTPVLEGLRELGYVRPDPIPGVRDGFMLQTGAATRIRVKIQKRNGTERAAGQHSFGVCHLDFRNVDAFVFWIQGLTRALIIPTNRLSEVFEQCEPSNRFANPRQWEVVFRFDRERALLEPIGSGSLFDVSDCCVAWPRTAV